MMGKGRFVLITTFMLGQPAFAQQPVDPTRPQGFIASASGSESSSVVTSALVVSAVFIKENSKSAVINGDSVTEGQDWKGNKVKKIHKNGVVLIVQGRETELFVNPFSIKKDATNDF
ncbi:MSHA biogenesis protein MshK [Aliiglaciecola sp.]|nr:MSHA biogenesis protein MshK [Aliiglaciecola sp.]